MKAGTGNCCSRAMRRIFTEVLACFLVSLLLGSSATAQSDSSRVAFHDGKLSLEPAKGWAKIERPDALVAFASADKNASLFITIAKNDAASSMDDVLTGAVANYEEAFQVNEKGEYRWGKVQGPTKKWNAIFTTLELEMVGKPENIPFRFYLTIFDTGTALYLIQASTMKPVKEDRQKEILTMIRSVIAHP